MTEPVIVKLHRSERALAAKFVLKLLGNLILGPIFAVLILALLPDGAGFTALAWLGGFGASFALIGLNPE